MTFHRRVLPTYFIAGGNPLLAGYDMINDPAHPSVGGSGVPVSADGKKSGGPNDGTYFVAFGEDGTSSHTNRPASALAENTDALDDIVRTSIPVITFVDATAVGATSTHALVGQIYVGKNGSSNNQAQRDKIVRVTDQNNNDLEVSGTKIVASLIHDGASVNVVGTQTSGFRTNASVNFNVPIPDTTTYRVWFGIRDNYANISLVNKGALFEESLRTVNNIPGEVRSLFRQIHSEAAVNQAFDAAFDSTIRSLAASGLDDRYRRATTQPAGFVTGDFNVAGAGRIINRDAGAVEIITIDQDVNNVGYPDPQLAAIRVRTKRVRSNIVSSFSPVLGGDVGLMYESEWQSSGDFANEVVRNLVMGPVVQDIVPRDIRSATLSGNAALTFINDTANATLNPDSGGSTDAQRTVQCPAGQYFLLAGSPNKTAIRVGIDLLEIKFASGIIETYVIDSIVSATRVTVRDLNGTAPTTGTFFGITAITDARIRWIQVQAKFGGCQNRAISSAPFGNRGFPLFVIPPAKSSDTNAGTAASPAFFGSQISGFSDAFSEPRKDALWWGSADDATGLLQQWGRLLGDGGIDTVAGRQRLNKLCNLGTAGGFSGSGTTALTFTIGGSHHLRISSLTNGQTRTFNVTLPTGNDVVEGDQLFIHLDARLASTGATTNLTFLEMTTGNFVIAYDPDPGGLADQIFPDIPSNDVTFRMRGGTDRATDGFFMTVQLTAFGTGVDLFWLVRVFRYFGATSFPFP